MDIINFLERGNSPFLCYFEAWFEKTETTYHYIYNSGPRLIRCTVPIFKNRTEPR